VRRSAPGEPCGPDIGPAPRGTEPSQPRSETPGGYAAASAAASRFFVRIAASGHPYEVPSAAVPKHGRTRETPGRRAPRPLRQVAASARYSARTPVERRRGSARTPPSRTRTSRSACPADGGRSFGEGGASTSFPSGSRPKTRTVAAGQRHALPWRRKADPPTASSRDSTEAPQERRNQRPTMQPTERERSNTIAAGEHGLPGATRRPPSGEHEPGVGVSDTSHGVRCLSTEPATGVVNAPVCLTDTIRSQSFSPSQRLDPPVASWLCFTPHPSIGFGLQSFSHSASRGVSRRPLLSCR
jgi:hypothetical protein